MNNQSCCATNQSCCATASDTPSEGKLAVLGSGTASRKRWLRWTRVGLVVPLPDSFCDVETAAQPLANNQTRLTRGGGNSVMIRGHHIGADKSSMDDGRCINGWLFEVERDRRPQTAPIDHLMYAQSKEDTWPSSQVTINAQCPTNNSRRSESRGSHTWWWHTK